MYFTFQLYRCNVDYYVKKVTKSLPTSTEMECPENSHYDLCGTECGHTCASSIDASCDRTCAEGCFCDDGFVRSGGRCVPVEQCGCLYDGFYFEVITK